MTSKRIVMNTLCIVLLVSLFGPAPSSSIASSGPSELEDIASEIASLKERNDRLNARLDDRSDRRWLADDRKDEIRTVVHDVLADTDRRINRLGAPLVAGYSDAHGFHLRTADDTFALHIQGMVQTRWIFNRSTSGQQYTNTQAVVDNFTGSDSPLGPENGWGFQIRRAKVTFRGHVVDPSWRFKLQTNFRSNGSAVFQDAYIIKELQDGFSIRVGQFKEAWLREEMISDRRQLAVERSVINGFFGQGRSVGLEGRYRTDTFDVTLGATNGMRTTLESAPTVTSFSDAPTDWSLFGRLQCIIAGTWNDFRTLNASIESITSVMIGIAGMSQTYGENSNTETLYGYDPNLIFLGTSLRTLDGSMVSGLTADVSVKHRDLTFFAALAWQQISTKTQGSGPFVVGRVPFEVPRFNPWGFVVQAGWAATKEVELFARYSYLDADMDDLAAPPALALPLAYGSSVSSVLTVGVNWFLSDKVKVTVDTGLNLESSFAGISESRLRGAGWVPTSSSDQWNLRAQLQLQF